uniref:Uncharacterized protein n=1 Tax=Meloidogyne enterolobii TaxID=390850 RepID=A0A6V7Y6Q4_MELEN|nr:unnamed protein product [Meloidogyne enterolobii]
MGFEIWNLKISYFIFPYASGLYSFYFSSLLCHILPPHPHLPQFHHEFDHKTKFHLSFRCIYCRIQDNYLKKIGEWKYVGQFDKTREKYIFFLSVNV